MFNAPQVLTPYNRDQIALVLSQLSNERLDATEVENVYRALVVHRAEIYGADRLDANETMVLTNQLEVMRARASEIKRPVFKARQLIPVTSEVDPAADSYAYSVWDRTGMAKVIANYADDIPKVAAFAKKYVSTVETIALGYDWSWLEMLRTARAGVPLKTRKAEAVRNGFELRIEQLGAIGIPETGKTGLLNNANVPQITAAAPASGSATTWGGADKTPNEILDDLHAAEDSVITTTKGVERPDTLVLPLAKFRYLIKKPLSTSAGSNPTDTILKVFLEKSENIRNVEWWHYADTANTGGTPRAIMYRRDPTVVHLEIPLEQQEMPPYSKPLSFDINSVGRIGGVDFEYPLAAVYINGI